MDVDMAEHDDSMNNTTITQSTIQYQQQQLPQQAPFQQQSPALYQQPVFQQQAPYQQAPYQQAPYQQPHDASNSYAAAGAVQDPMHYQHPNSAGPAQQGFPRPTTAHSDTPFSRSAGYQPYSDQDSTPPYRRGSVTQQQQPAPQKMPSRPPSGMSGSMQYGQQQDQQPTKNPSVVIKVGMVGDAQIGKTSLMVKYVEGSWDEDYIQTLGVNFMEKTISIRNTEITFSIWDLGGQREFVNMLPLVCNDAVAILFMFDLTRKSTLNSIKEWYRQGRGFNKTAIPFLVGTKYDTFVNFPIDEQEEISNQAKKFAKAMKASLIFSSTSHGINVQKIFKIVLSKAFDLRCTIPEIGNVGEPLLLYQAL